MKFSKAFVRLNWISLVLIYLVVVAGSFVRITGSGMGCPDWPKCFGNWIPPTEEASLPDNYKDVYSEKREKKIVKFSKFLRSLGFENTAKKLESDPNLLKEEDFNARKTWTEYVNRLFGFLAGNAMLIAFFWILLKYRKRKLILITFLNLVLMGVQGWFGSIVVASNLVPWTITVHMFLALVIIAIQLYVIRMISPSQKLKISTPKWMYYLLWVCFVITIYQMFLGTQVREAIDVLTKRGYGRDQWTDHLGMQFYIHRSFSWLVLVLLTVIAWKNERGLKYKCLRFLYVTLALELLSGVLLAYADMPGLVQTSHLIFATVLFGILTMLVLRGKIDVDNSSILEVSR
ncbi:MAG: COX15/CtaA family protein [Crocinitomicaceae bacterium]|nr:COX15/CtaA family protein [Crocinitomicaceae bacterium]